MSTPSQLIGGVVGALIGGFALPGAGFAIGAQLGMTLGGLFDPPKRVDGPRLSDLSLQTSTLGVGIPRGYGTWPVTGNVFWLENNRLKEVRTSKKTGGKGGPKVVTRSYSYYATFAVGLADCRASGPIAGVRRIWLGPDLWYDAGSDDPGTIAASNQAAEHFVLYPGSATQDPDPRIQSDLGVNHAPAWRGRAYLVFYDLPLANYGNTLAALQVKVEVVQLGETFDYPYTAVQLPAAGGFYGSAYASASRTFCAVSLDPSYLKVAISTDSGLSWSIHDRPGSSNSGEIASDGSRFVALFDVGRAGVYVSADGLNWVQTSFAEVPFGWPESYWLLTWCGSHFVVANGGNGYWMSSPNGFAWTKHEGPEALVGGDGVMALVWSGRYLIAHTANGHVLISPNGFQGSWTLVHTAAHGQYNCGTAIGARTVCLSSAGNWALISDDYGVTWSESATSGDAVYGGSNLLRTDNRVFVVATSPGAYATSPDGIIWTSHAIGSSDAYYLGSMVYGDGVLIITPYGSPPGLVRIQPTLMTSADTDLATIVRSECLQSGLLELTDLITTSLTDTVHGYRLGTRGTIRAALEPLQLAFPFDCVQSGYQIAFRRRPQASVGAISADDLDARPAHAEAGVRLSQTREIDSQLARTLTVNFLDRERDYDAGAQAADRLNSTAVNETTVEIALCLSPAEAAGIAENLLYLQWSERLEFAFTLPPSYAALEAGDVVDLPISGDSVAVRLTEIAYQSDGRLACKGKRNAAARSQAALGVSSLVSPPATLYPIGPTWYELLDLPRLSAAQDTPGMAVAAYGSNAGWSGGVLMTTVDGGASFTEVLDLGPPGATLGIALTAASAVDARLTDHASVLQVSLVAGELESVSHERLLAGANHFAYGQHGRWEILGARTVTANLDGTFSLRDLLRGRFGTEWAMDHPSGDTLVLLDTDALATLPLDAAAIGSPRGYRAISYGLDQDSDSTRSVSYAGVAFRPWSPASVSGDRDPATGDWTLNWVRRSRTDPEWRDNIDCALGETSEAYEIDVWDPSGGYLTIVRTIRTMHATANYPAAEQTADHGAPQTTLYLSIYQLSALVGRGTPLTTSITRI